jgi:hypothetical protein
LGIWHRYGAKHMDWRVRSLLDVQFAKHMEVSSKWGYTKIENRWVYNGKSIYKWMFWIVLGGTPISGNLQISALMTS